MQAQQTTFADQVRRELEGKRKPFVSESGVPVIYPVKEGVFVFGDKSGVAYLNGDTERAKDALTFGLEGHVVLSGELFIVPIISKRGDGSIYVSNVCKCFSPSTYRYFPRGTDSEPKVYDGEK